MKPQRKLLLVDRQPLFRRGVAEACLDVAAVRVVGEAQNVGAAIVQLIGTRADMAVVDAGIYGEGGLAAIAEKAMELGTQLIIVTSVNSPVAPDLLQHASVAGAILRADGLTQVTAAIGSVASGGSYFSPGATALFAAPQKRPVLSARQRALLHLMAEGLPNSAIAERLALSVSSINAEVQAVLRALDTTDRTQAVLIAMESRVL
ncbi:two-component system, NarL family, nitrate/nitrite response regulator NarL [Luteibacter sp. UNCMF331Sha3.1]|nr:two-component system, NarL family, nitrate/nitrite response regulator NarL [Luteibacter sp. UNCMF331Sha3.1]